MAIVDGLATVTSEGTPASASWRTRYTIEMATPKRTHAFATRLLSASFDRLRTQLSGTSASRHTARQRSLNACDSSGLAPGTIATSDVRSTKMSMAQQMANCETTSETSTAMRPTPPAASCAMSPSVPGSTA